MLVQFLGLGYIGLPTAAVVAHNGVQVHGVDVNPRVVETINRGDIHIIEPGLAEVVREGVKGGKLKASTEPKEADVHLVVVPTPFKGVYEPDISFVEAATRKVLPLLKECDTYIVSDRKAIIIL